MTQCQLTAMSSSTLRLVEAVLAKAPTRSHIQRELPVPVLVTEHPIVRLLVLSLVRQPAEENGHEDRRPGEEIGQPWWHACKVVGSTLPTHSGWEDSEGTYYSRSGKSSSPPRPQPEASQLRAEAA